MKPSYLLPVVLFLLWSTPPPADGAGLFEKLFSRKKTSETTSGLGLETLSEERVASGLKEALDQGVKAAVASLGRPDGFLKDAAVRIPMPQELQKVERALRLVRQDRLADEFVTTLNRAAEQAVPEATDVLVGAIRQMTWTDAKQILVGTNQAATLYFRRTSETNLHERFLPIVRQATEKTGVTRVYKQMIEQAQGGKLGGLGGLGASLLGVDQLDLDRYVTQQGLEGLFRKIGNEEDRIRETAGARSSDLLKEVFGAVQARAARP